MDRQTASVFASLLVRDWRKTYGRERDCFIRSAYGAINTRRTTDADIVRYQLAKFKANPGYFWFFLRRVSGWAGHGNKYADFIKAAAQYMRDNFPDIQPLELSA